MSNPDLKTATEETGNETWHFRGYAMRPGEFNTAMVHFYRGEVSRSNTWRARLDGTSNWAVVTIAALLTFSFGRSFLISSFFSSRRAAIAITNCGRCGFG
jgi:uncharacterized membrane protein